MSFVSTNLISMYFFVQSGVEKHYRKCHQPSTCEVCGAVLSGEDRLIDHMGNFHKERLKDKPKKTAQPERRPYLRCGTCPFCGEYFALLPGHIKRMHSERPELPCKVCGKVFKSRNTLSTHFRREHVPKDQHRAACHLCDAR